MLNLSSSTRVFLCSELIDARWSFDALSGLVESHFGQNPRSGYLFVFFNRRRDRMKILFWDTDGFALYYKRLERGTFAWIQDLHLQDGGEIQSADFSLILTGINPCSGRSRNTKKRSVTPHVAPLQLV
jgi:transposase